MKYFLWILFLIVILSITCGYVFKLNYSEKLIGFGVLGLFFVVIPLFIYHSWKGKKLKDYTLTKENLEKMRENQHKKNV